MTAKPKSKAIRLKKIPFGTFFGGFVCAFALAMILKNSEVAIGYVRSGLKLCAASVIPSLFPFMVISELLVSVGFGEWIGGLIGKPVSRLFGIPRSAVSAVLLGAVCGFPVGAKTAVALYDRGTLSRHEASHLLTFCNIPSSGFLISVVGCSLFSDRRFGIFLYVTALVASLLMGLLLRPGQRRRENAPDRSAPHSVSLSPTTFTSAVSAATAAMLSVCAYVIFFSSVIGCLSYALEGLSLPAAANALLYGVFELSSGVSAAASSGGSAISAAVCGFIVGWSGLSVHFQILSFCGGREISFLPYFLSKFCQGILCAAASWVYAKNFFPTLLSSAQSTGAIHPGGDKTPYTPAICLIFLICILFRYGRRGMASRQEP